MYNFFRWLFGMEYTYFFDVSFSKYGNKSYPHRPKSQTHYEKEISNSFCNGSFSSNVPLDAGDIFNRAIEEVKNKYPKSSNFRIEWITVVK